MDVQISYKDLLIIISSIIEDEEITSFDELFNYLRENSDLIAEIESI